MEPALSAAIRSRIYVETITSSAEDVLIGQSKIAAGHRYPPRFFRLPFIPHPESSPFLRFHKKALFVALNIVYCRSRDVENTMRFAVDAERSL